MKLKTENTMNQEMNSGRKEDHGLHGIHLPGIQVNFRKQPGGNPLQFKVQQTEQTTVSGYFRSPATGHDPARGEAG
jgi:hypothetical protein